MAGTPEEIDPEVIPVSAVPEPMDDWIKVRNFISAVGGSGRLAPMSKTEDPLEILPVAATAVGSPEETTRATTP